jgi:hypothetical protein
MAATFFGIAVDCTDAAALARFWGAVLDRQVAEGATPQHAILLVSDDPAGGPPVTFQQVPEAKTVKNRLHLDLITDTFDAENRAPAEPRRPQAARRPGHRIQLDDLRRHRRQRVRPHRRIEPPARQELLAPGKAAVTKAPSGTGRTGRAEEPEHFTAPYAISSRQHEVQSRRSERLRTLDILQLRRPE